MQEEKGLVTRSMGAEAGSKVGSGATAKAGNGLEGPDAAALSVMAGSAAMAADAAAVAAASASVEVGIRHCCASDSEAGSKWVCGWRLRDVSSSVCLQLTDLDANECAAPPEGV